MNDDQVQNEQRVLVVAPTTRDGAVTHALLAKVGLTAVLCRDLRSVCDELEAGAAALLLTSEALSSNDIEGLVSYLRDQPSWSDLPIVLLVQSGLPSCKFGGRHTIFGQCYAARTTGRNAFGRECDSNGGSRAAAAISDSRPHCGAE